MKKEEKMRVIGEVCSELVKKCMKEIDHLNTLEELIFEGDDDYWRDRTLKAFYLSKRETYSNCACFIKKICEKMAKDAKDD